MHRTALRRVTNSKSCSRDSVVRRTSSTPSSSCASVVGRSPVRLLSSASTQATRIRCKSHSSLFVTPLGNRSVGTAAPSLSAHRWQRQRHFSSTATSNAKKPFILADIGEGITQVEIVKWNVEVGQVIQEFDPVVEVMSDKATVEITSPYSGKIVSLSGGEGDTISVGKVLLEVEVEVEGESEVEAPAQTESLPPTPTQTPTATEQGDLPSTAPSPLPQPEHANTTSSSSSSSSSSKKEVWATPATRRLAKEHNLDLSDVQGTGPQGRVLKGDVLQFVANGKKSVTPSDAPTAKAESAASPTPNTTTTIPLSPIRKAMYRAMTASLQIPHFSYSDSIDVTNLERLRTKLNKNVPLKYRKTLKPADEQELTRLQNEWNVNDGQRVEERARFDRMTMLPLLIKVLSLSMHQHPLFSCMLDSSSTAGDVPSTMTRRPNHDISIALSAPFGGLFTPCLPSVDTLSSFDIASQIVTLQSIAQSTLSGAPKFPDSTKKSGTITLSNVGVVGGTTTHPIVPPTGQLAIGAIGRTRVEPKFVGQELDRARNVAKGERELDVDEVPLRVEPRLIMDVTFSADHRVVEGVELAKLVETWKRFIEDPDRIVGHAR
ncbi:hypothetical protein ACM66B_004731 [Microbotryomycetes sp. NB124-2]